MRRVLPVLLLVFASACSKEKAPSPEPAGSAPAPNASAAATAPATAGTPATPPTPGAGDPPPAAAFVSSVPAKLPDVLARINGEPVNKAEFEKTLSGIERQLEQQNGAPVPPVERDRIVRGLLDRMIAAKLLFQESKARKIAVTDAEVDAQLAQIRGRFPSEEAFTTAMASEKVTVEQLKSDARQNLMINKLLEAELGPKVTVKPEDVAKAYKENLPQFQVPEQVRASHILIRVESGAAADVKQAALTKANSVLKSARSGKDFAELAKEFSQDPGSAAQGGDLGLFAAARMVPEFSAVAFKLKPGAISDVVETQFGYHIIKVTEKQPARTVKLEEAKPEIERQLLEFNRNREMQTFLEALRKRGKVEVLI